jgi:two-component system, NtrC family, sensor histidine kinase HydH
MSTFRDWTLLFAAIGLLSLAVMSFLARGKSTVARPLALMCLSMFGWNFTTLANHVVGGDAFSVMDSVFTAVMPPLVLEVVLAFIGQKRRWRPFRLLVWLVLGSLAVASLGAFGSTMFFEWISAPSWSAWFLVGWVPTYAGGMWLLARHLGATADPNEKARTRMVLAALSIGGVFCTCDILHQMGLPLPHLGALGTLLSGALLSTCVIRLDLLDRNVSIRTWIYVLGMIALFVTLYLIGFRVFAGSLAVQAFATTIVTVLVVIVARELTRAAAEARERLHHLAVLGRFSAQMAHDIRNPLSALLGAGACSRGRPTK